MAQRLSCAAWSCSRIVPASAQPEDAGTGQRAAEERSERTRALPQVEPAQPVYPREFAKVSSLRKLLWWNTTREGLVELLRYADRNSMAHSREVRLPFLDHNLVEFVFKVPDRLLMRDGWTKWIIREAFRGIVPKEISDRVDKLGYMPPQQQWLNGLELDGFNVGPASET